MKYVFIILTLFYGTVSALAQENDSLSGRHSIITGLSYQNVISLDQLGSPLRYKGFITHLAAKYQYTHPDNYQEAYVSGGFAVLSPTLSYDPNHRTTSIAEFEGYYSYLKSLLTSSDKPFDIQVGGSIDNVVKIERYKYFGDDMYSPDGISTWDGVSMLEASVLLGYELSSSLKARVNISLPVISAIARPGYGFFHTETTIFQGSDIHIVFPGAMTAYRSSVGLELAATDHILLQMEYQSRYFRYERYGLTTAWLIQGGVVTVGWRI